MNSDPIVVEQTYAVPPALVWKAITEPDQMRQWFFETMTDFQPEVGFETKFDVENEGVVYPHHWIVKEVVAEKRLAYSFRFGGIQGDSTVTWVLAETENGTKLTVTHEVHEPFPKDDPIFSRESALEGWEYLLPSSLLYHLEDLTSSDEAAD